VCTKRLRRFPRKTGRGRRRRRKKGEEFVSIGKHLERFLIVIFYPYGSVIDAVSPL